MLIFLDFIGCLDVSIRCERSLSRLCVRVHSGGMFGQAQQSRYADFVKR